MDINSFFNSANTIDSVTDDNYEHLHRYFEFLDAFTRTTYKSLYVIDYFKKSFLYVSENPLFLCGLKPDEVKRMGYGFYFNHIPEDEIEILKEINFAGFKFVSKVPVAERKEYTISYEFNIISKDGKLQLINHQLTPISLDQEGKIWLALCVASISRREKPGYVEIYKNGSNVYWQYDFLIKRWKTKNRIKLTQNEVQILRLSVKGLTSMEMARELSRSQDAIKSTKRKLFEKLGVNNITEAVYCAMIRRLI